MHFVLKWKGLENNWVGWIMKYYEVLSFFLFSVFQGASRKNKICNFKQDKSWIKSCLQIHMVWAEKIGQGILKREGVKDVQSFKDRKKFSKFLEKHKLALHNRGLLGHISLKEAESHPLESCSWMLGPLCVLENMTFFIHIKRVIFLVPEKSCVLSPIILFYSNKL